MSESDEDQGRRSTDHLTASAIDVLTGLSTEVAALRVTVESARDEIRRTADEAVAAARQIERDRFWFRGAVLSAALVIFMACGFFVIHVQNVNEQSSTCHTTMQSRQGTRDAFAEVIDRIAALSDPVDRKNLITEVKPSVLEVLAEKQPVRVCPGTYRLLG